MSALNGQAPPADDLHAAAKLLYSALKVYPWFAAVEIDEIGGKLVIEALDERQANAWIGNGSYFGFKVDVRRARRQVR